MTFVLTINSSKTPETDGPLDGGTRPKGEKHAGITRAAPRHYSTRFYHLKLLEHTVREANRLGLEFAMQVSEIGRPVEIAGPWRVRFSPNRGAPAEITLPELMLLHKRSEG